jgi:dGTPase
MDWADEITYATHDLQDFLLVGKIPSLEHIQRYPSEFLDRCEADGKREAGKAAVEMLDIAPSTSDRIALKDLNSFLVSRFVDVSKIDENQQLLVPSSYQLEVEGLAQLTWQYVIKNPDLATRQAGQAVVLQFLFDRFLEAVEKGEELLIPGPLRDSAAKVSTKNEKVRLVADCIASLTEGQAYRFHRTLSGYDSGSILDSYFSIS